MNYLLRLIWIYVRLLSARWENFSTGRTFFIQLYRFGL